MPPAPTLSQAVALCNRAGDQLEAAATVHAIVREHVEISVQDVMVKFFGWSPEKRERFTGPDIERAIAFLVNAELLAPSLFGLEARASRHELPRSQAARI